MRNALSSILDDRARDLLVRPDRWAITVAGLDAPAVPGARHAAWMRSRQHAHGHLELMLVLEGDGLFGAAGRQYRYRPGSVLVFPPHTAHDEGVPPWTDGLTRLWVSLASEVTANLLRYRNGRIARRAYWFFPLAETGLTPMLVRAAGDTVTGGPPPRLALIGILALVIARLVAPPRPLADRAAAAPRRQRLEAVRRHIEDNWADGIRLQELAETFGMSRFHLSRLFKRHTGHTIHQYLDQCRLQHLHKRLRDGVPRKDIARQLGFSSQATFTRWEAARHGRR